MTSLSPLLTAHEGLEAAMRARGFEKLTAIQEAVLAPELAGRDLRLSSQTGSGKTVAVGLLIAPAVEKAAKERREQGAASHRGQFAAAEPTALIVAPTRELASQLERELTWLFAPLGAKVAVVTGGTSVYDERRALGRGPTVVVGTPGRLLDHLRREALRLEQLTALALDEADVMIDMDFEEELEAILAYAPAERRTHLVSATFRPQLRALADRLQDNAAIVQGTVLGKANEDIDHQAICIEGRGRFDAVVNLLLHHPDDKTLLFVRTRADTTELADMLSDLGFAAGALNGDMSQRERTSAFARFRSGALRYLVATDVAARGLDVQDIARVIQVDLPDNADTFTHRSGRTGRAGRRGTNTVLVPRHAIRRAQMLFRNAKVRPEDAKVPDQAAITAAADERLRADLRAVEEVPQEALALAQTLLAERSPEEVVAWLLSGHRHAGPCDARKISVPAPHKGGSGPNGRQNYNGRFERGGNSGRSQAHGRFGGGQGRERHNGSYVTFQVSWGALRGADARRLLAIACRRGDVSRADVGAIRISPKSSSIEIAVAAASRFESAATRPDPRDPHVRFRRWESVSASAGARRGGDFPSRSEPHANNRGFGHSDSKGERQGRGFGRS